MATSPSTKKGARRGRDRRHACDYCSMTFTRSEHCARHQRGHTRERPFPCRYCSKSYSRSDVAVRHEKDLHWEQYVSRASTSLHSRISARTSESPSEEETCDNREAEQRSTSGGQNTPQPSMILSDQRPGAPDTASDASSPSGRIQRAIAAFDFTALHAEALSRNYMASPVHSPPSSLESLSTEQTSSDIQPLTPDAGTSRLPIFPHDGQTWTAPDVANSLLLRPGTSRRQEPMQASGRKIVVADEEPLTFGPVFDPLWDPAVTKTAAINGYVADLHREMMVSAGLWGS